GLTCVSMCQSLVEKLLCVLSVVFFFQAEDGIRDRNVTGVQTCALPISALFEEAADEKEKKETALPPLEQGQRLDLVQLKSEQKFTQPPAPYTEASLIKAREENGIGRPSTYGRIITTIIDRRYVERDQKKLKPTPLGRTVYKLMLEQFPHIVDVDFSAQMEKNLDKIESGKADWRQTVDAFYKGFDASLQAAEKNMAGKKIKVPD